MNVSPRQFKVNLSDKNDLILMLHQKEVVMIYEDTGVRPERSCDDMRGVYWRFGRLSQKFSLFPFDTYLPQNQPADMSRLKLPAFQENLHHATTTGTLVKETFSTTFASVGCSKLCNFKLIVTKYSNVF